MIVKAVYKILRSIIFSVTLVIVGLYVLTYTLLAIPWFTNWAKDIATAQISNFLGATVRISDIDIYPFNEVKISNLEVYDPGGELCLEVETIGAGISLWKLLTEAKIDLTFGEIIGLKANLVQAEKGAPLNIDFILKAFSSQDDNKEKKPFELSLRNVVLRKSAVNFRRDWAQGEKIGSLDLSDIDLTDLAADITFPKISDKGVDVDLRRLSFKISDVLDVEKIGLKGEISDRKMWVDNFILQLPGTQITIPEIHLDINEGETFEYLTREKTHAIEIRDSYITPSDFEFINPLLSDFNEPLELKLQTTGNLTSLNVKDFYFGNPDVLSISFAGSLTNCANSSFIGGEISGLKVDVKNSVFSTLGHQLPRLSSTLRGALTHLGDIHLNADVEGTMDSKTMEGNFELFTDAFKITYEGKLKLNGPQSFSGNGEVNIEDFNLRLLFPSVPLSQVNANVIAEGSLDKKEIDGVVSVVIEDFEYQGRRYEGLSLNVSKDGAHIEGDILMNNRIGEIEGIFGGETDTDIKNGYLDLKITDLDLSELIDMKKFNSYLISGEINLNAEGKNADDVAGELNLSNFTFASAEQTKRLNLKHLEMKAWTEDSVRNLTLNSDWLEMRAEGPFRFEDLPGQLTALAESVFPSFVEYHPGKENTLNSDLDFDVVIKKNNSIPEFFNLPVRLLVPVTISGSIKGTENMASLTVDVPYLQQGKDKLIYDSRIVADINGDDGVLNALITTTMPVKKGDLALNVNLFAKDDGLSTDVHWINTESPDFKGHLSLETEFSKNRLTLKPEINLQILPSLLQMGSADWNIARSEITYKDNSIAINGLRIWHDNQQVEVDGVASEGYSDVLTVKLDDIDVDYIFNLLQINYVTFGGTATGELSGHSLLSSDPVAETEGILIKNFTYNGCYFGECKATSRWNNDAKEIEIGAQISNSGKRIVDASGGIWLGRDSLSFDIDAKKVPVDFVQPFMAVFSSHVGGYATGDVKLFGTFHDIDMTGRIFADSVAVKLDYTNTVYHGSDSVILTPGRIDIPHFMLHDKFGNSALLTGELTHRYFHDPSFNFRLTDADNFLCYDTTKENNPDWYGTLYGTGSAILTGEPGLVSISADMTVGGSSSFTFELNDTQYARDYQFLTFSDSRKEELEKQQVTVDDFKAMLRKSMQNSNEEGLSKFGIDIRATVTPQALFTLVMDPAAGDKITARGKGAMQMKYESDVDEVMIYGKYEIEEGNYNFSLQDIILRDFKIKEGSFISFNGDPLAADLDISATYRVNTNLSELDKSFSTDRDLNRTNVPVDAVLSVAGNMQQPDITFDIELPTLTQDVERKVKSIISTDDMMNRQIIYLLALNRFYTPEYMGTTGNGGELAAVASTTISSQLSNMLGQLTDKFSVSPSFRSDKGDFSDIEVDVALSSKLLNNRLLINGNLGYRDRSNSSTTFVGDFDVEYLLSKNGNLRLKAYNHFNDQNYYLREALTTQGLGLVFRKDFDNWFTFMKKRQKNPDEEEKEAKEQEQQNQSEPGKDGTQD